MAQRPVEGSKCSWIVVHEKWQREGRKKAKNKIDKKNGQVNTERSEPIVKKEESKVKKIETHHFLRYYRDCRCCAVAANHSRG